MPFVIVQIKNGYSYTGFKAVIGDSEGKPFACKHDAEIQASRYKRLHERIRHDPNDRSFLVPEFEFVIEEIKTT